MSQNDQHNHKNANHHCGHTHHTADEHKNGHNHQDNHDTHSGCEHRHDHHTHKHETHSTCNHHNHSHDHKHHHDHTNKEKPENYNYGTLKYLFSKIENDETNWLERHRSKAILAAAGTLAAIEYHTANTTSLTSSLALIFGATVVAHDASEDLMEATGKLNETHQISSGVVGMGVGMAHTVSEGLLSVSSQVSGYEDLAISATMGSNVSHIPLMAGMAGIIGAVSIDKLYAYKMNAVAMASVTSAFAYQIATGEFNPYLSSGMVGAGIGYLGWRVKAGQTCAVHGDACGHTHNQNIDETDYISTSYWKKIAENVKNITPDKALERLTGTVQRTKNALSKISLKPLIHENITTLATSLVALGVSAHVLGDNVIKLAEQGGISATAMGATVAALAFALPELILTGKAAMKKDGEMAWGAITGCTIATVGIVGGYQGLSNFDIPASLSLATTEGKVQMAAFAGSAATIIGATHPKIAGKLAKLDNATANWLEKNDLIKRAGKVSNWLRNDGTKLSKAVATPMLASAITFYALNTQPNCHWHGNSDVPHCIDDEYIIPETMPAWDDMPSLEELVQ